jgi:hypothetical protein
MWPDWEEEEDVTHCRETDIFVNETGSIKNAKTLVFQTSE